MYIYIHMYMLLFLFEYAICMSILLFSRFLHHQCCSSSFFFFRWCHRFCCWYHYCCERKCCSYNIKFLILLSLLVATHQQHFIIHTLSFLTTFLTLYNYSFEMQKDINTHKRELRKN